MKRINYFRYLFLLLLLTPFKGNSQATMIPLPPHGSLYTGTVRGYWFTAPANFNIVGLRVPTAVSGDQYIHLFKINDPAGPPAYAATTSNFTTLAYVQGAPSGVIVSTNIPIKTGDIIGVLGAAGTGTNCSYAASTGVYVSSIMNIPVNLTRLLYQGAIVAAPAPNCSQEVAGNISRVEIYYSTGLPCTDTPKAQVVGPNQACVGDSITLTPKPYYNDAIYQWQYSPNGVTWSNYIGNVSDLGSIQDVMGNQDKYYRCSIKCTLNNYSYVTPAKKVQVADFYYCYCKSKALSNAGMDIGNVTVIDSISDKVVMNYGANIAPLINNSGASASYSAYQDSVIPIAKLYRDTGYRFQVTKISSAAASTGYAAIFVDLNRDGIYDQFSERVFDKAITNPTTGKAEDTFHMPHNAVIGKTGMRVVLSATSPVNPCGTYGEGETEDYVVEVAYEPCTGPADAGTIGGDTSVCVGYDYLLTDTSYERKKSDLEWTWQVSGDNMNWANISGSGSKDTLQRIFNGQPLYYRTQMRCPNSKDTTYSNAFRVNLKAGYKCYCFSQAIGGKVYDSSDIGSLSLADYFNSDGGPHLQNGIAHQKRTDHTDEAPIDIDVDSMYDLKVFHTQWNANHGDAKITVFMDFNNNHIYDIPEDRIYTGYTSLGLYTLVDKVVVKPIAILDVPTGMRVIVNNNIAPNIPSDEACGTYGSGETEDYMIVFRKKFPAGVGNISGLEELGIYPNPTTGKFVLSFKAASQVSKVGIRITNVTGQELQKTEYSVNGSFTKEIDLGNASKGIYFVELSSGEQKIIRKIVLN